MIKRKDNQLTLGEAIRHLIADLGMEDKILSVQAEEIFVEMMGDYIMKYVEKTAVQKQILFIKINSPELRNELLYGKSKIIAHINEEIGKDYIKDVKFI